VEATADEAAAASLEVASNAEKKVTSLGSVRKEVVVAEVAVATLEAALTAAAAATCQGTATNPDKAVAGEVVTHEDASTAEKVAICPGTAKSPEAVAEAVVGAVTPEAASIVGKTGTCRETALNPEAVVAEDVEAAAEVAAETKRSPEKRLASKSPHLKLVVSLADKARLSKTYSIRAEPESRFIREMGTNRMLTSSGLKKNVTWLCS